MDQQSVLVVPLRLPMRKEKKATVSALNAVQSLEGEAKQVKWVTISADEIFKKNRTKFVVMQLLLQKSYRKQFGIRQYKQN